MVKLSSSTTEPIEEYEIRLRGILGDQWTDWFDGMEIRYDSDDNTTLTGPVVDQAALHGLLDKVRDMGMILLSVTRLNRKFS